VTSFTSPTRSAARTSPRRTLALDVKSVLFDLTDAEVFDTTADED
jgi:hypothetical protein